MWGTMQVTARKGSGLVHVLPVKTRSTLCSSSETMQTAQSVPTLRTQAFHGAVPPAGGACKRATPPVCTCSGRQSCCPSPCGARSKVAMLPSSAPAALSKLTLRIALLHSQNDSCAERVLHCTRSSLRRDWHHSATTTWLCTASGIGKALCARTHADSGRAVGVSTMIASHIVACRRAHR